MNAIDITKEIFKAGVESVLPDKMIRQILKVENDILYISELEFPLSSLNNIYIIGAGKASALMAKEVENILGNKIHKGHIIVKYSHTCELNYIKITEAGHPTPDKNGFKGTKEILELMKKAGEKDLVICLLSGGGSSLLADYPEKTNPEDMIVLNHLLLKSGANIHEMNVVRKHFSEVKGGKLAKVVYPAPLVSLILSDVIGDSLDIIASGPTSPDKSTFQDVQNILEKYELIAKIPDSLNNYLENGIRGLVSETPKKGDPIFNKVHNKIIGSNTIALENSRKKALNINIQAEVITSEIEGEVEVVGKFIVEKTFQTQAKLKKGEKYCLLFGGEPTIHVSKNGIGGRNQHLALFIATLIQDKSGITVLSAGTDGNDGPTDAAGAVVDNNTYKQALLRNIEPYSYLAEFDSYNFFKKAGGHIITGSTLTNVMDLIIVLIEKD